MEYQDENEAIIEENDEDGGWVDTHHNAGTVNRLYRWTGLPVLPVFFFSPNTRFKKKGHTGHTGFR